MVGPAATAFPHRAVGYNFLAVGEWMDASTTPANIAWAREAYAAMAPHFTATIPTHAFFVENGKTNEIKVTVTRNEGFKEKLVLSVKGLPDGVTARPAAVSDKSGEVKLELLASEGAKAASN